MSQLVQYRYQDSLYTFNTDAWFNATEAAARFGKRANDFLSLPATKKYIAALDELEGTKGKWHRTKRGRRHKTITGKSGNCEGAFEVGFSGNYDGSGTWLHPELAVAFARWLDTKFAIWCDRQIKAIITGQIQARGNPDLIGLYLRPTAAPWEKRFPDDYYRALAHLTRTDYSGHIGGTPAVFGQLTDRWVYALILPADVHIELRTRRDESQKMHQWLSNGGADLLEERDELRQECDKLRKAIVDAVNEIRYSVNEMGRNTL